MRPIEPRSVIEPDTPPPIGRWVLLVALVALGWFVFDGMSRGGLDEVADALRDLAREAGWEGAPARESERRAPAPAEGSDGASRRAPSPAADVADLEPMRVDEDVRRPRKIAGPNPQYTEMARRARIQGVVILEAVIDRRGDVVSARVLKPLPMGLDQAAVDAVRQWKFEPAMLHGEAVDVYYNLTVNFRLQ